MAREFVGCQRGQLLLMPPSLGEWLPEDHLVWTVLGAVDQMDLDAFYGAYRSNGQGRAAYDPATLERLEHGESHWAPSDRGPPDPLRSVRA